MAGARDEAGYLHVRHLGAGSFGSVAVVERGGSEFVLKSMDTSRYSAKERQRALQEIQILAAMDHVNIVKVRTWNKQYRGHVPQTVLVCEAHLSLTGLWHLSSTRKRCTTTSLTPRGSASSWSSQTAATFRI